MHSQIGYVIISAVINLLEDDLSRVINTQSVGQERTRLTKSIVVAIRELVKQSKPDSTSKDLAAFIVLALVAVDETVERTVTPWEKRDYWVKADRFRRDWDWAKTLGEQLRQAVKAEEWGEIAMLSAQIGAKLTKIQVSPRHRLGTPWVGAWKEFEIRELGK